ncbi:MAG: metallophosphoesterase [Vagococcus sp.]
MKYLVVSDNHGDRDALVDIDSQWYGKVDAMFHCGDSELETTDELWQHFVVVKGNCDYVPGYDRMKVVSIGSDIIFTTHGHLFDVNQGLTTLGLASQEKQATIAIYGHTHKLAVEYDGQTLFLNPGSISQPRGMYSHLKTYALIESTDTTFKVDYYDRQHNMIPDLSFVFSK